MELRAATTDDITSIREVATASLSASYAHAVDEEVLSTVVTRWYDAVDLTTDIENPKTVFPVAVLDGHIVAFAESYIIDRRDRVGEIDWLHVHPDHRGKGIGSALLERVETELRSADVDSIEGKVLADNTVGTSFYEREGYELVGEHGVDIGTETFTERVYTKRLSRAESIHQESYRTDDGDTVYVVYEESERGSSAPFYSVYSDEDREDKYGYLCGECESTDVAIDTMDRLECLECGNHLKPVRWDAAY